MDLSGAVDNLPGRMKIMDKRTARRIKESLEMADTPEKVWEYVEGLLSNPNGYSDTTILENARAYVAMALNK